MSDIKTTLEEVEQLLEQVKEQNVKRKLVVTSILWATTGILVILKAAGLSSLSWFWTTFILLLPIYIVLGFLALCLVVLVGAACVFAIIAAIEYFEAKKRNGGWR